MKVTRAQAEANHRVVIASAGRLFREHGFDGVGLNDVMGSAGLTRGGFYKQFASKDDLIYRACDDAFDDSVAHLTGILKSAGPNALAEIVSQYLSRDHRDHTGEGCLFAALGCEVPRCDSALRGRFREGVQSYLAVLDQALAQASGAVAAQDSAAVLATMVGALQLSRIVIDDHELSQRILDNAAATLLRGRGD